jgi:hypothetical protein
MVLDSLVSFGRDGSVSMKTRYVRCLGSVCVRKGGTGCHLLQPRLMNDGRFCGGGCVMRVANETRDGLRSLVDQGKV